MDEPVYVVHDPVAFRSHRISLEQYRIALLLDGRLELRQVFQATTARGFMSCEDEKRFYEIVGKLYEAGLVVLPLHNGRRIYDRYCKAQTAKQRSRWLACLFLQLPLASPDRFLSRTQYRLSWLFTNWFLRSWLAAATLVLILFAFRWRDFIQPLNGILSPSNLPLLWLTFVGLKLWHELGHGYACKSFGGRVPEMGAFLVAGNPLAYVDATSAWSFPERRKRLAVMAGGMYFESLIAIPAFFVWCLAGTGLVQSLAYQVVVTASVVTLLFNANPLMKFDGYFILCELTKTPNLRTRATAELSRFLKRYTLGIPPDAAAETGWRRSGLLVYAVAASVYRVFLVLSIAAVVATRFPLIGLSLAAVYVGSSALGTARKVVQFLLQCNDSRSIRLRARCSLAALCLGIPVGLVTLPVPFSIVVWGVVAAEEEHLLRTDTPGTLQVAEVTPGQDVSAGEAIVQLANQDLVDKLEETQQALREARLKWEILRDRNVAESTRTETSIRILTDRLAEYRRQQQELRIKAPSVGRVLNVIGESDRGRFFQTGEAVGLIAGGRPVLRTWLNQDQLNSIRSQPGCSAKFRVPSQSTKSLAGKLIQIKPAAESVLNERALSYLGGGDLMIDPQTGRPLESLFQVEIESDAAIVALDNHGSRVAIAFDRKWKPIGVWIAERILRFVHQLWIA